MCSLAAPLTSSRDNACLNTRIESLASTKGSVWLHKNPTLETVSLPINHIHFVRVLLQEIGYTPNTQKINMNGTTVFFLELQSDGFIAGGG